MRSSAFALAVALLLAALFAYYSARLAFQSWQFNDISTGNDATPLWIPQLTMAAGTLVLMIAFADELFLEWTGRRADAKAAEAAAPRVIRQKTRRWMR